MKTLIKARSCCLLHFYQWKKDLTIQIVFVAVFILIFYYTRDVSRFSEQIDSGITPWLFPVLFSDFIVSMGLLKVLLYFGLLFLFCRAPFIDRLYVGIIIRSGSTAWAMGQMIYIAVSSFFYTLYIYLVSVIVILPEIEWSSQWGKTIGTLALTDASTQAALLCFPKKVIANYRPIEAVVCAFLLVWLTCCFLGLLLFFISSVLNRNTAVCVGCLLILMDPIIMWLNKSEYIRYSPVSWSSVENIATNSMSAQPGWGEAMVYLFVGIVIVSILVFLRYKRRPVEQSNQN